MKPDSIRLIQSRLTDAIEKIGRPIRIMEVCGTHTVALFRHGIRSLLPTGIRLLSGPGCPVCVTDQGTIDTLIELAQRPEILLTTYGDMIRVPGSRTSLEKLPRSHVRIVLSTDDALEAARRNPDKMVVFAAVGFETTAPATAAALRQAHAEGIENFTILCAHKLVVPAMRALLEGRNDKIDAFLCPGHVSVIIGSDAYRPIAETYHRPCVVAGFEPMQILEGIVHICDQLQCGRASVESVYQAAVRAEGNRTALKLLEEFFEPWDGPWRGLGRIPGGTLRLKKEWESFDILKRMGLRPPASAEPAGCLCGQVLCGLVEPSDCPLFGNTCRPNHPIGPCMVSSEGACSAWYKYQVR
jgi:hydrogenase expression/formation protein HypD